MRNINEENKRFPELTRHPDEENPVPESDLAPRKKDEENPRPDEKKNVEEENQLRSKDTLEKKEPEDRKKDMPKKVANVSHAVSASLASVAVVLVVASVVIIGKDFLKSKPTFEVTAASYVDNASENGIAYTVNVSKNPDNVPLLLKMAYADEFGREKDAASVDISAVKTYSGVLPIMKYAEAKYTLKVLRTDHNTTSVLWASDATFARAKESKFYGFFWECHCTDVAGEAAGKAYYQLAYVDDFARWDSFEVHLVKTTDAAVTYSFPCEAPYHEKHLVDTITKEGGTYAATIVATPPGGGTKETVYSAQVEI